jgi:putative ABC transport system permease protein
MHEDLKAAVRSLRASKSFTFAALLVLTLGVGATTAIFSVVDAVVLRGLPFDEHDRLVAVGEVRGSDTRDPEALSAVAPQNYVDWAAQQQVFDSIAAIASGWLTLHEPGAEPESLVPQRVTAGFFDVLRVRPAIGRPFTAENEIQGRDRVAILSDGLWRRRFGGDPAIIGRTIPLDDVVGEWGGYEVLGVMPPGFAYPSNGIGLTPEIWIPYVVPANQRGRDPQSHSYYLQVIARLKPGVSVKQASAQMRQIAAALERAHPEWNKASGAGVRPLVDHIVGSRMRSWMLMLLGAVAIVLLIACTNVANLLLARSRAREREIGIRAALGATRWRLVRQLLVESLLLSALGTACAIVVATWAVHVLRAAMPPGVARVTTIALDMRVLAAAAGLSLLTGVLFGIVPALQLSRPALSEALKEGGRTSAGGARQRLRSALVVGEVALAVVLLVGAALFVGSFVSLMRIDPGFNPENVLTAMIAPRIDAQQRPDSGPALVRAVEQIGQIPGVVHASIISGGMPLGGSMSVTSIEVPGRTIQKSSDNGISIRRVTAEYHLALGIPLRSGRLFDANDRKGAPGVVIINESAARKYFPREDPIGRVVILDKEKRTIVGVVGDVHQTSLETDPRIEAYIPMTQGWVYGGELVIKTSGPPYSVLPAVKAAVAGALPDVPLRNVRTMEELFASRVAQRRFNMLLIGLFGLLGLVIAAVGIYGLMAYLVARRTREIGLRMALGATRSNVIGMVVLNAAALVGAGALLGSIGAWYLSAAAKAFLFRLQPTDPRAFAAALVLLITAALIASVIPARRAASVDPMVALRSE